MATPALIGLDIGSNAIRAVELSRTKDRLTVDRYGEASLPTGATTAGVVTDDKAVTATLRQLWSEHKFRSKSVRLGVTHQQVLVREVEVADLPPREMKQALPHQVRDVLPFAVDQAILDFYRLPDTGAAVEPVKDKRKDKRDSVRGLLVAAPKEAIIESVRAVEKAGLHVARVDLACFAVLRALAKPCVGAELIADIGAKRTLVVIHSDGVPQIVRTIPRGGDDITATLTARLGLPTVVAEEQKRFAGIRDRQSPVGETVLEAVSPLVNEIRSSVAYFGNTHQNAAISRVCLVGGAAQLAGLTELISGMLALPVHLGDPLQYVQTARHRGDGESLAQLRASSAVSVGLALGAS